MSDFVFCPNCKEYIDVETMPMGYYIVDEHMADGSSCGVPITTYKCPHCNKVLRDDYDTYR